MSLAITKTIISPTGTTVIPGQNIVYALTITNNGPDTSFTINDPIPVGTSFVSFTTDTPNASGTTVIIPIVIGSTGSVNFGQSIGLFLAGQTVTYLLTVKVNQTAVVGSVIQNLAESNLGVIAVSPPLTVVTPVADLSISILGPAFGFVGGTDEFVTTVHNRGPSDATNLILMEKVNSAAVKLTQLSGPSFTIPAAIPTIFENCGEGKCTSESESVSESYTARATAATFPAHATATFLLSVIAEKDKCKEKSELKVFAQVGSDTADSNLSNNVDFADTLIESKR